MMGAKTNKELDQIGFINEITSLHKVYHALIRKAVSVKGIKFSKHIEITNCEFEEEIVVKDIENSKDILFINCTFKQKVSLLNSTFENIRFSNCTFSQTFVIKNLRANVLVIEDCKIENDRELKLVEFKCRKFLFQRNDAKNDIYIKPQEICEVVLEGSELNYLITFTNNENEQVIEKFTSLVYSHHKTDYLIRNIKIKHFILRGELSKDSSYTISQAAIFSGLIDFFSNYGTMRINAIEPLEQNSILIIKDSSLGKAQISRCNFKQFSRVALRNSTILEIVPNNNQWCGKDSIKADNIPALRENYRQLKLVASKNEDTPLKLFFHKLEMHTYLKQLTMSKASYADRFILFSNLWTNDFGLNWFRTLGWIIGSGILFYTLVKYDLGQTSFDPDLIPDEIGRFFLFLNPVHSFEKIFRTEDLSKNLRASILLDSLFRILNAYLLFQFISAFRKYSNK